MRELLELAANDQPAVAVEDGVYRVQAHAYGVVPGRDPGLRRLAAAVIGGTADAGGRAGDDLPVRRDEGDALQVTEHGIELDAFTASAWRTAIACAGGHWTAWDAGWMPWVRLSWFTVSRGDFNRGESQAF